MTSIADILAAADPIAGGLRAQVPADWMQGRTAYGGLSTALALHIAQASAPDLPPLRSAQVSFIGPLAGAVEVTATLLRRGRTAAFVQCDIGSAAGLGYRATFVFMAGQPSRIALAEAPGPPRPPIGETEVRTGPAGFFTGNFDYADRPDDAPGAAEWLRWVRLRARAGLDPMVQLLAVADGLPPAALKLLGKELVPISSLTWLVNLLTPAPTTDDGWWLLSAHADHAREGCSSQVMRVRNAAGELVAEGMQSVAIFG